MAHPVPDHTTVPAAELRYLHEQMMRLTARVGLALDAVGVDVTGATPPTSKPCRVVSLADHRARRQAAS